GNANSELQINNGFANLSRTGPRLVFIGTPCRRRLAYAGAWCVICGLQAQSAKQHITGFGGKTRRFGNWLFA
ncbi:MAG: hypothetical protein ACO3P0_07590, partial [Quisquiliibacterium sp.]